MATPRLKEPSACAVQTSSPSDPRPRSDHNLLYVIIGFLLTIDTQPRIESITILTRRFTRSMLAPCNTKRASRYDTFERLYPDEEACRKAWFARRWPRGLQVSAVLGSRILRYPRPSTAAMPALSVSVVADCRHRPAGHRLSDAGVVSRRAPTGARTGKKGLSNIELGRRLGVSSHQCRRAGSSTG